MEEYEGPEAARANYLELLRAHPEHRDAAFAMGRIELEAGSELGVTLLRKLCEQDARYGVEAYARIIDFYRSRMEEDKARAHMEAYDRFCEIFEEARKERDALKPGDKIEPHGLEADAVSALVAQLEKQAGVAAAWLVRKKVAHFPDMPLHVLAIQPAGPWWKWRSNEDEAALVQGLAQGMVFPGETFVITANAGGQGGLYKRITKSAGAKILGA